jgi:hypothetical protein
MVSSGRLERYLPTFYSWGRGIKRFAVGNGGASNIDIERLGVGKVRCVPVSSALAPQHLIDPYMQGAAMVSGPNTDSARPLSTGGGLDNYSPIKRMSVFNTPAIKDQGVPPLAGQHLIDPYHPYFSRSDQDIRTNAEYSRLYREQAGRMRKFVEREELKLDPGVKERLLSKAAESDRIALQLSELSSEVKIGAKDRRAERWQTVVSIFDADKIGSWAKYDQGMFGLIIDEKAKPLTLSDADQMPNPLPSTLKKNKAEEWKREWENVGSGYSSIRILYAKLIDLVRSLFK